MTKSFNLGVDTGGTFTDFVLTDGNTITIHKVLSTPDAPEQAVLQGIKELGLEGETFRLVHGSTVATNALLERKGVRTAFVTNKGFRDVLIIGRQARKELYNLTPKFMPSLVDRELCLEVDTRLDAQGNLIVDLQEDDLQNLISSIQALKPDSIAISLLFSFLDDRQEQRIKAALPADLFVSISSEILPEYKEYERGITTWLNSYVGPLVQGYLQRMEAQLPEVQLYIMQSSGSTCSAEQAGRLAVNLLLSGPAGGLEGVRFVSGLSSKKHLMTLDMGGTSTDVALVDDVITLTSEGKIGEHPVSVPMVDIHTIGAGGGSIAWVDEGGLLQVGPQSAGAVPGPVCYGQGGERLTVTDANLILGRLPASSKLGGNLQVEKERAHSEMTKLAKQLGLSTAEEAAAGVIKIANEHMASALRVISVQKGHDPKGFSLVCFGGAGGLHICELAESLSMDSALVPVNGGVLSALGMLTANLGRQLSKTLAVLLHEQHIGDLEILFDSLSKQGIQALIEEGVSESQLMISKSFDLCYKGQSSILNLAWQDSLEHVADSFHKMHEQCYGHRLDVDVELTNIRVSVSSESDTLVLPQIENETEAEPAERVLMYEETELVSIWERDKLVIEQLIVGPAIIKESVSTTLISSGWECVVDKTGNLLLNKS